jgi:hypothetical protein
MKLLHFLLRESPQQHFGRESDNHGPGSDKVRKAAFFTDGALSLRSIRLRNGGTRIFAVALPTSQPLYYLVLFLIYLTLSKDILLDA